MKETQQLKFKDIKASYGDENEFFIVANGDGFKLYVEPTNRRNGTQNFDAYFPRYCSTVSSAKASLTKFLGKPKSWQELTESTK